MPSICFVVPVHGRLALTSVCLRQLRRTCDALIAEGLSATAAVVGSAYSLRKLDPARLGFLSAERDNMYVSRKFNDGIQLATDPKHNPSPADYVVPCGSDDWVDHRLFLPPLPDRNTIFGFQRMSFVREDGKEIVSTYLGYEGGAGIRIIPRELVAPLGYRPADEDRASACDTSILRNLRMNHRDKLKVKHWHLHDRQIVDWKTEGTQLNSYSDISSHAVQRDADPFRVLAEFYPAEALEEMRVVYGLREEVPA